MTKLCLRMNTRIPRKMLDGPRGHGRFWVEYPLVNFLYCDIQSALSGTEISEDLRQAIQTMLRVFVPLKIVQTVRGAAFAEGLEIQRDTVCKVVEFKELQDIFLPGELVYARHSESVTDVIQGIEWVWDRPHRHFCLASRKLVIDEYTGRVSLEDLGIVPLAMMEPAAKAKLQNSLISRGKSYMALFKSGQNLWEICGSATLDQQPSERAFEVMGPEFSIKNGVSGWNPTMKFRAMVTHQLHGRNELPRRYVMDTSEPINDETYMIFPPDVWVEALTSRTWQFLRVSVDYLSPIRWNETPLNNEDNKICGQILSILRVPRPLLNSHAQVRIWSTGLIMIVYGDMLRTVPVIRVSIALLTLSSAAAERDHRGLLEIDLLDLVGKGDELSGIRIRLSSASLLQGLILLQNFAPLVAKRSYDDRERCEKITRKSQ
ncbi:hypothetical protein K456DRAFT_34953 [Colletotrichum gloeosporioides 23]|nr:hypothetical protein K456DRAFT_34953 [Colletotrichum gloeosporioides 23]